MKRLFLLIVLAILLAGLVLFQRGDTAISVDDAGTFNNEVISTSNSSASATIVITMYAVAEE